MRLSRSVDGDTPRSYRRAIAFRSPSLYQRYVAPIVVPVYSMPWVLCTAPLTLLILLVIVERTRGRGFDAGEEEQAAMARAVKALAVEPSAEPSEEPATAAPAPAAPAVWGSSEWGSAWGNQSGKDDQTKTAPTNGHAKGPAGDPWSSGW